MSLKIAVLMDPIEQINIHKDSTFAMMLEAQARGHQLWYLQQADLYLKDRQVWLDAKAISVRRDDKDYFTILESKTLKASEIDVILMRKDPPFNMEFVYTTYLLQLASDQGCLVVNNPRMLREANEKLYTAWFSQCCTDTLVSRKPVHFREFLETHKDIIVKPLDGMGGSSIFRLRENDPNISVVIETLTAQGKQTAMAQKFIPQIVDGDKRILMINGEAVPYCLARIPAKGETRGNLAAGGHGKARPLTERDHWIANQVGPTLRQNGLLFVGLDVIGDYLTEINVTSPTCIQEIDKAYNLNIAGMLFDAIEERVSA